MARKQGKRYFDELRNAGPLTREGQPPSIINNASWQEIKKSPDTKTYKAIPYAREAHATGDYYGPTPTGKQRNDGFFQWHWYQKPIKTNYGLKTIGVQVGEDTSGMKLHNIAPDVEEYLLKHPEKTKSLGITPSVRARQSSLNNSIHSNGRNVKPLTIPELVKILQQPFLSGYTGGVVSSNIAEK
jgi:hypothetical protein